MKQLEINYYIPTKYNNGVSVAAKDLRDLEDRVISLFGGLTIHSSLRGMWLDHSGVRYDDPIIILQVIAENRPDLETRVKSIGTHILKQFNQREVFIFIRDVGLRSLCDGTDHQPWDGSGARNGKLPKELPENLTNRERQILGFAAAGYTNREIGRVCWITEATVENHMRNIFRKLGVSNRVQAAIVGLSLGIIQPKDKGIPS